MLEPLGVTRLEESLYELLLDGELTVDELCHRRRDLSPRQVHATMAALQDKGLARLRHGTYEAVLPDEALDAVVVARRAELDRAEARVRQLSALAKDGVRTRPTAPVELVFGDDTVTTLRSLHDRCRHQLRAFETPPYSKQIDGSDAAIEVRAIRRGVAHRVVYSRAAIEAQGLPALVPAIAGGEQARVVSEVPVRLAVFDGYAATLPLRSGRTLADGMLVVHPSALLDALVGVFEAIWASALPIDLDAAVAVEPEVHDETLIALMASGMTDQAIARELGVSLRTVGRKIQRIQSQLNAATRFQAGVAVGARARSRDDCTAR